MVIVIQNFLRRKKRMFQRIKKQQEKNPAVKKSASKKTKKESIVPDVQGNKKLPVVKKEKKSKATSEKSLVAATTKFIFQLKFHTNPGESIFIIGDHEILGNDNLADALPMQYLNDEHWVVSVDFNADLIPKEGISYNYAFKHLDGFTVYDWGEDKKITPDLFKYEEVLITDSWNHAGFYSNAFYTEPFQNVL